MYVLYFFLDWEDSWKQAVWPLGQSSTDFSKPKAWSQTGSSDSRKIPKTRKRLKVVPLRKAGQYCHLHLTVLSNSYNEKRTSWMLEIMNLFITRLVREIDAKNESIDAYFYSLKEASSRGILCQPHQYQWQQQTSSALSQTKLFESVWTYCHFSLYQGRTMQSSCRGHSTH